MSLQDRIVQGLRDIYTPLFLEVVNDSEQHRGHKGMEGRKMAVGKLETHFTITLVCDAFRNLTRIQRHRHFYDILSKILEKKTYSEIHALSLRLVSPEEFERNL
ncbi:MAG TPA: BolA family protein [Alphaproteobacteria bacterium]|nr:BolA family protein [Alphaproteobacteria bacterium]HQS93240.1 BolA family protein [Alphaproteobacteria bacterium]